MMDFAPTPATALMESVTSVTDTIPTVGNAALCADSLCTTTRAGINFYCSPNPVSKIFFGASCLFGVMGAVSSGTALVTSFSGMPVAGCIGSFGARGFNRLGRYTMYMGNVTNGNITNVTEIADLMN